MTEIACRSDVETWKPIPGYEGLYEASSQGRIRSAEGKVTSSARYNRRVWQQRIIKQKWRKRKTTEKEDARVCLWKDGKEKTHLVSRLIAMAFLPAPFEKLTVNHIDGDPSNNSVDNLEWCTMRENIKHAFDTGLQKSSQKPVVLESVGGNKILFPSMAEASRYLGKSNAYVSNSIANCNPCYGANGEKYFACLASDSDAEKE